MPVAPRRRPQTFDGRRDLYARDDLRIQPWRRRVGVPEVPAVLQALFDDASGNQPAAMANLKLWQSLGIGIMFGLAQLNSLKIAAVLLLGCLLLSSAALLAVMSGSPASILERRGERARRMRSREMRGRNLFCRNTQ